jgi:RNA polymerase sigma-70 factor (ECF subfamily)
MVDSKIKISIETLHTGDRREFARLVDAYSGPLRRLALKMLGNEPDAEDVLQNVFLKAFQHIDEFEGRSSLSTWLYRIASNEALMLLRKLRPESSFTDTITEDEENGNYESFQFTDWSHLPEEEFLATETHAAMDRAIQHLPVKLRIVFVLRDIEDLSIREASQSLGLTETAVKTRLLRARLRLREELSSYFDDRLYRMKK